jgi:hypothetical protein
LTRHSAVKNLKGAMGDLLFVLALEEQKQIPLKCFLTAE